MKKNENTINLIKQYLTNLYQRKVINKQGESIECIVLDIKDSKFPEKTSFELSYEIKVNGKNFLKDKLTIDFPTSVYSYSEHKTNITIARIKKIINFYKNAISANMVYINFERNELKLGNFIVFNDIEVAKKVIDSIAITDKEFELNVERKFQSNDILSYKNDYNLQRWNALPKFTKEWLLNEIKNYEIYPRTTLKMKYLLKRECSRKLNLKFINDLIEIYEKKLDIITPIDVDFIDFDGELIKYLKNNALNITLNVIDKLQSNKNIYSTSLQTYIRKYLNGLEGSVRNVQEAQDTNPLSIAIQGRKIYFLKSNTASPDEKEEINIDNFYGVIDASHTAEKQPTINNKLTNAISFKDNQMYIKVYDILFREKNITIDEYLQKPILTYDMIDYRRKKVIPQKDNLYSVYYLGEYTKKPLEEIPYYRHEDSNVSPSSARIPFNDKGYVGRSMYGQIQQGQAMVTISSEPTIINTGADYSVYNNFPGHIRSPESGEIVDYKENIVTIKNKKNELINVNLPEEYVETMTHNFNKYVPRFKIGDTVEKNDVLFSFNAFTDDGKLQLSTPAYVAVMTFYSKENNDSFVVSRSFAKKMGCEEQYIVEIILKPNKYKLQINPIGKDIYEKLGLPKIGDILEKGSKIFSYGEVFDMNNEEGYIYSKLRRDKAPLIKQKTIYTPFEIIDGKVSNIEIIPITKYPIQYKKEFEELEYSCYNYKKEKLGKNFKIDKEEYEDSGAEVVIKIYIDYIRNLVPSAKLSFLNGNKGTVSNILDDDIMPKTADGKTIDMIISPLAIVPRMLGSQIYMLYINKLAYKVYDRLLKNDVDDDLKKALKILFPNENNFSPTYLINTYGYKNHLRFRFYPYDSSMNEDLLNKLMKLCKVNGKEKIYLPTEKTWVRTLVDVGYLDVMILYLSGDKKFTVTPSILYSSYSPFGYGKIRGYKDGNKNAYGNEYGVNIGEAIPAMQGWGATDELKSLMKERGINLRPEIEAAFNQIMLRISTA